MSNNFVKLVTTTASLAGSGSVTVATITSPMPGILGWIGFTTTTTIALPIAGIVAVGMFLGYGIYRGLSNARNENQIKQPDKA